MEIHPLAPGCGALWAAVGTVQAPQAHEYIEYTRLGEPQTTALFAVDPTCDQVWP